MDDRSKKPGTHRALIPQSQSRYSGKPSAPIPLAMLPDDFGRHDPDFSAPAARRSVRLGRRLAVWAAMLCLALIAVFYARLLAGPVSLTFLVPTVQKQINSQLQGYSFLARDAFLRIGGGWRLEFRLADVRLLDENNHELAKAPFASVGISGRSLFKLSLAASRISLLGPKLLVFNSPGKGLTLTEPPASGESAAPDSSGEGGEPAGDARYADLAAQERMREAARGAQQDRQGFNAQQAAERFNPAPLLARLFTALKARGGASSALEQIGVKNARIYFASERGVSTWEIADFHIDLEEGGSESALRGQLTAGQEGAAWSASFRAVNQPKNRLYSLTASVHDLVPKTVWQSFPAFDALKLADLPVSGEARFDIGHDGSLVGGEGEIRLRSGRFFMPAGENSVAIDEGQLKVSYDKTSKVLSIKPFELRWDDSVLTLGGRVAYLNDAATGQPVLLADLDGAGSVVGAPQFGVRPMRLDTFKISASYQGASDTITLKEFTLAGGGGAIAVSGHASEATSGGPIKLEGVASPMPLTPVKALWPAFVSPGAREWIGTHVAAGQVTGGNISVNSTIAALLALYTDGDIPDSAFSMRVGFSGLQIYHVKGLPPILANEGNLRFAGHHFIFEIPGEARIELPSGRSISFTGGQFAIDDLRPVVVDADVSFKGASDVPSVLELLDQPPLGYVKSTGFKPGTVNGQVAAGFRIGFPVVREPKLEQMRLAGKARISELKSNALPSGLSLNGGGINFDITESAISANGDVKVNNVPVTLAWQRIYNAPPERQPTLRLASILNEKGRDDLGLNVNHIVKGDLPIAMAVTLGEDGPPKLFMEANLTNTDIFLTAIGWRKPPAQKATLTFDLSQRPDNLLALENFALTGDGLNVNGRLLLNDKHRIALFNFPQFSTNALTQLAVNGELTPQNVLKVQAKGPSYDARQFFRTLFTAGRIADQPAPLKDEPGLDLNAEIETVFGYNDATVKSVVLEARRRAGKLSYLECNGRLNGEAPIAVHVEQKQGRPRMLTSNAMDAGSMFRLVGLISTLRGGAMDLQVNLDGGGGADKTGVVDIRRFELVGDEVVGKVITQAERERARLKPATRAGAQQGSSGERMYFDRAVASFAAGANEFHIREAAINGPDVGATMRGRIDFSRDALALSGTYVPLYGLNSMLQNVPIINLLLTGPRENEGVFGITFAIQGKTSSPDIIVNPASMLAPGLLRQIFEFETRGQAPQ